MTESRGATRAVDRMVDAIRAEQPPELDWDAVERSLLARIRRGEGARPPARPASAAWQALAFAAAAALVPLALSAGSSPQAPAAAADVRAVDASRIAAAPGEAGARGERDLGALRTGDAVEASASAVTFTDGGKVRWTLSPDSRLVVRSPVPRSGVGHVVRLTRGSVRVEVQPDLVKNGLVDVLAVEVGQTRVAVHGTVFTVTLRDDDVVVDVEHGVVTVGPAGQRGATTGYQLPAGSRAAFSLDGGRRARWVPREAPKPPEAIASLDPTPAAGPGAHHGAAAPAVEPDVALDEPPPAAPVGTDTPAVVEPAPTAGHAAQPPAAGHAAQPPAAGAKGGDTGAAAANVAAEPPRTTMSAASVQAGLLRCFRQAHPSSSIDGPKLTASSTFTLQIRADGSVERAQFSPPLPSIQGCAAFVYGGRFQSGTSSYTLSIPVQLSQ